jgi:hypothetical protein
MCYRDPDPWSWSDVGHALGSLGIIAGIVAAAIVFTVTVYERPSIDAQQIIQAGRTMVETVGR